MSSNIFWYYILTILVEMFIIYIFTKQGFNWLNILLISNMIVVVFYANLLVQYPFGVSNISNLFYSFIVPIQFIILKNYGKEASRRVVRKTLLILSVVVIYRLIIVASSSLAVEGNESIRDAFVIVTTDSVFTMIAAFSGFYFAYLFFLSLVEGLNKTWYAYLLGVICWQAIDSMVFFPILFLNDSDQISKVEEFILVGFLVKAVIGFLMLPLIFVKPLPNRKQAKLTSVRKAKKESRTLSYFNVNPLLTNKGK